MRQVDMFNINFPSGHADRKACSNDPAVCTNQLRVDVRVRKRRRGQQGGIDVLIPFEFELQVSVYLVLSCIRGKDQERKHMSIQDFVR
jgi:hypothetical protein